jgi:hypothetical protein
MLGMSVIVHHEQAARLWCCCMCVQGLAPLVDIPELERSILGRGGNINYKHFFVKPGQADGEWSPDIYDYR